MSFVSNVLGFELVFGVEPVMIQSVASDGRTVEISRYQHVREGISACVLETVFDLPRVVTYGLVMLVKYYYSPSI